MKLWEKSMNKKHQQPLQVIRKANQINGDTSRVITCPHIPGDEQRVSRIIQRVLNLSKEKAYDLRAQIMADFSERHENIESIFERNLYEVKDYFPQNTF
jgi:hypothetical protein